MASTQPPPNPEGTTPPPDHLAEPIVPIVMVGKPDDTSGRGRTFIATRKIVPGEVIWISMPAVYPASISSICFFCSRCYGNLPSEPLHCTTCNMARFCSMECLMPSHPKLLCSALPSLISGDPTLPEESLFISADSKWPEELIYLLCVYSLEPSFLLQFISLRTNLTYIPDDELVGALHSQLTSLIHPNLIPPYFSPEMTSYILSNKKNHSFSRILIPTHPQFKVCGVNGVCAYDIHLELSGLNHECLPNVCVFNYFDHRAKNVVKILRALHEIDEGTEISISYLPISIGYRDRQRMLMQHYGFRCECVRCDIESQWKEEQDEETGKREVDAFGYWCLYSKFLKRHVCDCGGCLAPFPPSSDRERQNLMECNKCHAVRKYTFDEDAREDDQVIAKDFRKNEQIVTEDVREDEQAVPEDVRKDEQIVTEDVREDEQAVAGDVGEDEQTVTKTSEKMSKLLLEMSEKTSKMVLGMSEN